MHRSPVRPQRSPGAPRPPGRFPSPGSSWGFPGALSPCGSPGHRGTSPRGCHAYSAGSPVSSPGSNRGYRDSSPAGFGSGSRGYGAQMRRRGDGFRRPQSFSPKLQPSNLPVEKYFSPSMLQDPWAALQPLTAANAGAARHAT